jgi:hypothetical protein
MSHPITPESINISIGRYGKDALAIFTLRRQGTRRDLAECDAADEDCAIASLGKLVGHSIVREPAPGGRELLLHRKGALWGKRADTTVWTLPHAN